MFPRLSYSFSEIKVQLIHAKQCMVVIETWPSLILPFNCLDVGFLYYLFLFIQLAQNKCNKLFSSCNYPISPDEFSNFFFYFAPTATPHSLETILYTRINHYMQIICHSQGLIYLNKLYHKPSVSTIITYKNISS